MRHRVRAAIWSLLASKGVDLVVNGHDHTYQRWVPLDGTGAPVLRVVGVGGAGVNAINRMVEAEVEGVEFLAINTDATNLALQVALLVPILAALLGLANSFRMTRRRDPEPTGAVDRGIL